MAEGCEEPGGLRPAFFGIINLLMYYYIVLQQFLA